MRISDWSSAVCSSDLAQAGCLARHYAVDETFDAVSAVDPGTPGAERFRRGWFLGDGTGAGKGRQVAGIILDNWLKGRRRALWSSKSDKLIEDPRSEEHRGGQEGVSTGRSRWSPYT